MRIDCSKTINFIREFKRMCDFEMNTEKVCHNCPFKLKYCSEYGEVDLYSVTPEIVELVQKWSDEHPQETIAEHFFKMFPNAPKSEKSTPNICPQSLGWLQDCPTNGNCLDCWNIPYIDNLKK